MNINLGLTADATGTVDVITATYSPAPTLVDKKILFLVASGANTSTTPSFSPNGLTAHTITKDGGSPLSVGDIAGAGHVLILEYNLANTRWELLNPSYTNALALNIKTKLLDFSYSRTTNSIGGAGSQVVKVLSVAAGEVAAGDILEVYTILEHTSSAANKTWKFYINTSANLSGSPIQIGQSSTFTTGATTAGYQRYLPVASTTSVIAKSGATTADNRPDFQTTIAPSAITVPDLSAAFFVIIELTLSSSDANASTWGTFIKRSR